MVQGGGAEMAPVVKGLGCQARILSSGSSEHCGDFSCKPT